MLISGKFEDNNGVIHKIPVYTIGTPGVTREQQVIRSAHSIAWSRKVKVVRVWGVYQTQQLLKDR